MIAPLSMRMLVCALPATAALLAAQTSRPERTAPPRSPAVESATHDVLDAVRALRVEARAVAAGEQPPRSRADFAESFPITSPREAAGGKLLLRADRDPYVDAYVRWQLTSYEPLLPELIDPAFARWIATLPEYADNPRADERLVREMMTIAQAGALSESDQAEISERLETLAARTSDARRLNEPARQLREWIEKQVEGDRARRLLLALEQVASLADSGWSVREIKGDVERLIEASARDESFTADDRRRVVERAGELISIQRLFLASARIDGGALSVEFDDAAIYDFEVRRWARLLEEGD